MQMNDSAAFNSVAPNPNILMGALVAGPTMDDVYADSRSAANSGISLEFNSGFTGALAMLAGQDYSLCDHRQGVFEVIGA